MLEAKKQCSSRHLANKPETVDTLTTKTMKSDVLGAAKTPEVQENMQPASTGPSGTQQVLPEDVQNKPSTTSALTNSPLQSTEGSTTDITDDTSRASTLVSEVIQSAKTAVDDALSWAEKKVDTIDVEKKNAGPYDSPGTCMPSDLDAIANGILPAISIKSQSDQWTGKPERDMKK